MIVRTNQIRFPQAKLSANVSSHKTIVEALMRYLIQTFLADSANGEQLKYEIYLKTMKLDAFNKVPEGSCRIMAYKLEGGLSHLIDDNVDVQPLFDANQPEPNAWYSDGPHRVDINMLIEYLIKKL